ncbi:recombinase family protein [Streptomyces sp. Isolate_45]|uniref:recombinase family protein n=1 Tax=Streptomyces sp. Isolate_45 TaxID=2950111 RepID=UPI002481C745|nr:recombinase family protein [Streptomyces sp. Isolate_45]MDA5283722.1 recombinase family protein [Streptomyces sp. Isolate_45]
MSLHSDPTVRTAVYLRCYPRDVWQMELHRAALLEHAHGLGWPEPLVFLDNGRLSHDSLPALEQLLALVAEGWFTVVLVPGWFVFALDDEEAARIVDRITSQGCRVEELPGHGRHCRQDSPAVMRTGA